MRSQPLICVRDVEASNRWYQRLLGCQGAHGGSHYERLVSHGDLILQLHRWDVEHHHRRIGDPNLPPGNGVLLWFEVSDFDAALDRVHSYKLKSFWRAIATRLTMMAGRTIGKSGCVIRMDTQSCLPARTVQPMELGDHEVSRGMSEHSYASLTEALKAIGLTGQQGGPDQLIVSAQQGSVWRNRGNSFWLSCPSGNWYLTTWSPGCYRIPKGPRASVLLAKIGG